MTRYTITIKPSDPVQTSAALTVEVVSQQWRVIEVSVRLGASKSPFPDSLSKLDFQTILETIILLSRQQLSTYLISPEINGGVSTCDPESRIAESCELESDADSTAPNPPLSGSAPRKLSAHQSTTPNKAMYDKEQTVKIQMQREDMPSDLAVVYWREGTIAKVADYYSVPRRVAQRWIKLLQQAGGVPNPWRTAPRQRGNR